MQETKWNKENSYLLRRYKGLTVLRIEMQLFGTFCLYVNGVNATPEGKEAELLALVAALGGTAVTAKSFWEIVEKPKRLAYNTALYTGRKRLLVQHLQEKHAEEILVSTSWPVRACKIDRTKIICDYYQMLDGKAPLRARESFLPEYPWAHALFRESWNE